MGQGRNPYQAVQNFRSALQRVVSCVTPSVIVARSAEGYQPGSEHRLALGLEEAVKLPGAGIALSVQIFARVLEQTGQTLPWMVLPFSYFYALRESEGPEIIAYHWHPGRRSLIAFPHLHLGAGSGVSSDELRKAHIPTGPVDLEDVLAMAIREFGVRPRRDDWEEILGPPDSEE